MGNKSEARLTSSLLARKGSAHPSAATDVFSLPPQAVVTRDAAADERAVEGWSPVSGGPSLRAKKTPATSPQETDGNRPTDPTPREGVSALARKRPAEAGPDEAHAPHKERVALTLRVDHARHKRLKLVAAHTGRSSQDIMTAALDAYLDQAAADKFAFCDCLQPALWCQKTG